MPSVHGIGSLGDDALKFIDLLSCMHVTLWQVLPLGPTGFGDSPYAVRSTFAGNELLIDLNELAAEGFLGLEDVLQVSGMFFPQRIDYGRVRSVKEPLLDKAAVAFLAEGGSTEKQFVAFCRENSFWLDDYALYVILCRLYGDSRWFSKWPEDIKRRKDSTLASLQKKYRDAILNVKVIQYFFFRQWAKVKAYANEHGIRIIGDIPIFVASDSVDAWCNVKLLKMDDDLQQTASSGVPPDAFSADGQLWGNPVYDWDNHIKTNFAWWTDRIRNTLKLCDSIRIDHFRGLSAYWEIPQGEKTAIHGKWVQAPGQLLLDHLRETLGPDLPFIAEDLGVITDDVEELRDNNRLPGMKILQFAFGFSKDGAFDASNAYLPHNCIENSAVYTGTHDNDTTRGWYDKLDGRTKDAIRRYLECPDDQIVWEMLRAMLMSNSRWAILPIQDLLELGSEGRMNVPSTCGTSNWSWRMPRLQVDQWRMERLKDMIDRYGRYDGKA